MSLLYLHDRRMTNSMAATNLRSSSADGHLSCASLQPTPLPFPLSNSPVLFRGRGWQGGKISSESRRLSSSLKFALGRRRLSKIVDWRRPIGQQASAHGHVKRAKQPCPTTTLLRGGPPTFTSHFASLTAADAHIPAACLFGHSSRLYAPSIGGAPAQPSLPRVRAICTLNSLKALADWAKLSSSSTSSFFSYLLSRQNQQVQPSSRRLILIPSGPAEILTVGNEVSIIVSEIWGLLSGRWLVPRARDPSGCRMPTQLGNNHAYCSSGTILFMATARATTSIYPMADGSLCTSCSLLPASPVAH